MSDIKTLQAQIHEAASSACQNSTLTQLLYSIRRESIREELCDGLAMEAASACQSFLAAKRIQSVLIHAIVAEAFSHDNNAGSGEEMEVPNSSTPSETLVIFCEVLSSLSVSKNFHLLLHTSRKTFDDAMTTLCGNNSSCSYLIANGFLAVARLPETYPDTPEDISLPAILFAHQVSSSASSVSRSSPQVYECPPQVYDSLCNEMIYIFASFFNGKAVNPDILSHAEPLVKVLTRAQFSMYVAPVLNDALENLTTIEQASKYLQTCLIFLCHLVAVGKGYLLEEYIYLDKDKDIKYAGLVSIMVDTSMELLIETEEQEEPVVQQLLSTIVKACSKKGLLLVSNALLDGLNIDGTMLGNPQKCHLFLKRLVTCLEKVATVGVVDGKVDERTTNDEEDFGKEDEKEFTHIAAQIIQILRVMGRDLNKLALPAWEDIYRMSGGAMGQIKPLQIGGGETVVGEKSEIDVLDNEIAAKHTEVPNDHSILSDIDYVKSISLEQNVSGKQKHSHRNEKEYSSVSNLLDGKIEAKQRKQRKHGDCVPQEGKFESSGSYFDRKIEAKLQHNHEFPTSDIDRKRDGGVDALEERINSKLSDGTVPNSSREGSKLQTNGFDRKVSFRKNRDKDGAFEGNKSGLGVPGVSIISSNSGISERIASKQHLRANNSSITSLCYSLSSQSDTVGQSQLSINTTDSYQENNLSGGVLKNMDSRINAKLNGDTDAARGSAALRDSSKYSLNGDRYISDADRSNHHYMSDADESEATCSSDESQDEDSDSADSSSSFSESRNAKDRTPQPLEDRIRLKMACQESHQNEGTNTRNVRKNKVVSHDIEGRIQLKMRSSQSKSDCKVDTENRIRHKSAGKSELPKAGPRSSFQGTDLDDKIATKISAESRGRNDRKENNNCAENRTHPRGSNNHFNIHRSSTRTRLMENGQRRSSETTGLLSDIDEDYDKMDEESPGIPSLQVAGNRHEPLSRKKSEDIDFSKNRITKDMEDDEDIVVAMAIEDADTDDLDEAVQYDPSTKSRLNRKIRKWTIVSFLAALVVVVILIVFLSREKIEANEEIMTGAPSLSPTSESQGEIARVIIEEFGPDQTYDDRNTAYGKAFDWITRDQFALGAIEPYIDSRWRLAQEVSMADIYQRFFCALFYFEMNGDRWVNCSASSDVRNGTCSYIDREGEINDGKSLWLSPVDVCAWGGITCNFKKSVVMLDLNHLRLDGTLPQEIYRLDNLVILSLINNTVGGQIPSQIGQLSRLLDVDLHVNNLSGEIPTEFFSLTRLHALNLGYNMLNGTIAPEIGNLTSLRGLHVHENAISGIIPSEIGYLHRDLHYLTLSSNRFSHLPDDIELLTNLRSALLDKNKFEGNLHLPIADNLENLRVNNNAFNGTLPDNLYRLNNLRYLQMNNNQFSGTIKAGLGNLTRLLWMDLRDNNFSGKVPVELKNLKELESLRLHYNAFNGSVPIAICRSLFKEGNLNSFYADCKNELYRDDKYYGSGKAELECECCTDCCDPGKGSNCEKREESKLQDWMKESSSGST